jgi:hypothetical protein
MPVIDHKKPLDGFADLGQTGQHGVGKNVFGDPGITIDLGDVTSNGVQQKDAVCPKASVNDLHETFVVFPTNVLKHADRDNLIKRALDGSVVTVQKVYRQIAAKLAGVTELLL